MVPNFLIVGGARCGSTSLWETLRRHPQIYLPCLKEPCFLALPECFDFLAGRQKEYWRSRVATSFEQYKSLFPSESTFRVVGEASTAYLYYPETAIPRIKAFLGAPKIIIMLRNPTRRAWSDLALCYRGKQLDSDINTITKNLVSRSDKRQRFPIWAERSFFASRIRQYQEAFPEVKLVIFEDLFLPDSRVLSEIYEFLEVDGRLGEQAMLHENKSNGFIPSSSNFRRISSLYQYMLRLGGIDPLQVPPSRFHSWVKRWFYRSYEMPDEFKSHFDSVYRDEIAAVENIIGRTIPAWHERQGAG